MNKQWMKDFEYRFGGEGRYLCLWNEKMNAWTSCPEEVKAFISNLIASERKEARDEVWLEYANQGGYRIGYEQGKKDIAKQIIDDVPDDVGYIVRSPDRHVPPMNIPLKAKLESKYLNESRKDGR